MATREQYYAPLFHTSIRQNRHTAQVIASIVHVTTQNSQQHGALSFYGFTAQRSPIPSAILHCISYINPMCVNSATESSRNGPVLIILLIFLFQSVY